MRTPSDNEERDAMELERFASLVDAYGAEPTAWPDGERTAALALLAESRDAQLLAEEAAGLDALLDEAPSLEPSAALQRRVVEAAPQPPRSWLDRLDVLTSWLWPYTPRWQPAAALVAAAVFGVVLGTSLPEATSAAEAESVDVTELAFGEEADWSEEP